MALYIVPNRCTAIYAYDRSITLTREIDLIWRRRSISLATGLYLLLHVSVAAYLYLTLAFGMVDGSCEVSDHLLTVRNDADGASSEVL